MGVYIKSMEMPVSCFKCRLSRITPSQYAWCSLTEKCEIADAPPPDNCPLGNVPTQHGRLIDADAIPYKKIMYDEETDDFYYGVTKPYIDRMPTIVEAEE